MIHYLAPSEVSIYQQIRAEALTNNPEAFGATIDSFRQLSAEDLRHHVTERTTDQKRVIVILDAKRAVAMCGFGISTEDRTRGFLWGLYVNAGYRKNGLGKCLIEEAEGWIAKHQGISIHACISATNPAAFAFYRKRNYEILSPSGYLREGSDIPVHPICKDLG